MRLNINLPGPFSVSTRITPNVGKSMRQVNRAARTLVQQEKISTGTTPPRGSPRRTWQQEWHQSTWLARVLIVTMAVVGGVIGSFALVVLVLLLTR